MNSVPQRRRPKVRVDGVLLLDKACGLSSNAALQQVRRLFNAAKAGHTGTLDPMATGLLPVALGEATKFSQRLLDEDKTYLATLRFGAETATGDLEGEVCAQSTSRPSRDALQAALARFEGEIEQLPPMYAALKHQGRPLYEYARAGIEIERAPRRVTLHRLVLRTFDGESALVEVCCSKGTYVRTLAADLGRYLGCLAHLAALRRTAVGRWTVDRAVSFETLSSSSAQARAEVLLPVDSMLADLPVLHLTAIEADILRHGQQLTRQGLAPARMRAYENECFVGLLEVTADGVIRVERLLRTDG